MRAATTGANAATPQAPASRPTSVLAACLATVFLGAASPHVNAEPLVGISLSGSAGSVDSVTGAIVDAFAGTGVSLSNALAVTPYGAYLTTTTDPAARFATVDPLTHAAVTGAAIDLAGSAVDLVGLAFASNGTLYGLNNTANGGVDTLWTIDLGTGHGTLVGATGKNDLTDLAIRGDGTLYSWSTSSGLMRGAGGGVFAKDGLPVDSAGGIAALAFGSDGQLYGAESALYRIDPTTGARTLIANVAPDLRGLAARPAAASAVPEPDAVLLLGFALAGFFARRGRRTA